MRLFGLGKKSNGKSGSTDVPPELQPYYGQPKKRTWFARLRLFVLPVLAVLLLIGIIIAGIAWMRTYTLTNPFRQPKSSSQTAQKSSGAGGSTNSQPTPSGSTGSTNSQPAQTGNNTGQPQPSSAGGDQAGASGASGTIPNTGPDDSVLLLSVVTGSAGAAAYHVRQMRRARSGK